MKIKINGEEHSVPENWQEESLLFVLREFFGLTGAKFGCGAGQCGACTVMIDQEAVRSCQVSLSDIGPSHIQTIEGLAPSAEQLHPVQQAWMDEHVPQCGYCQAGQIMSAVALLSQNSKPTDTEIDDAMSGNLCRCGTYQRIRKAIHRAAEEMS